MATTLKSMASLPEVLSLYLASREASGRYRESLLRTVRKAQAAGLETVEQLQPELVNRFLLKLSTSAVTRQNVRRELLTLWRWAFEQGMTDIPPLRVTRIKAPGRPPQAWSLDELRRMLAVAECDETRIGGRHNRRICDWVPGWILIAYDSALRFGDVLALRSTDIRNGCVCAYANKTGKALVRPLSSAAYEWAMRLAYESPDKTLWLWFVTRRRAITTLRAFYDRHGFGGSSKYFRRSCATYIEIDRPGESWRYLQHSQPTLVQRHYVDASLCRPPAGPPAIR